MALGFYFSPKIPMSASSYNECIKRLKKAGSGHPRGRVYHSCFGSPDNLAVFDVWTSQAALDGGRGPGVATSVQGLEESNP